MDVEETPPATGAEFQNEVIVTKGLPQLDDLEFEQHPRRYHRFRLMWVSIFAFLMALTWMGLMVVGFFEESEDRLGLFITSGVFCGIWLLIFSLIFLEEFKGFPRRGFVLRERDITYRSGFLFQSVTTIPFNRIQHSEISQGPIARKFRLSSLKIYTAGGSGSDLKIAGLDPEEAQRLREFINTKSGKSA